MSQVMDHLDDVGPGWHKILLQLHYDLIKIYPGYEVDQLKEKFGGLHVYLRYHNLSCEKLIMAATQLSHQTCEECGESGETGGPSWIKTLCGRHRMIRENNG